MHGLGVALSCVAFRSVRLALRWAAVLLLLCFFFFLVRVAVTCVLLLLCDGLDKNTHEQCRARSCGLFSRCSSCLLCFVLFASPKCTISSTSLPHPSLYLPPPPLS